ncbi:hypothetical protein AXF42_Ash000253 [Apostasia shenzhenica]|uniref:Uncharacterized protein n=1 Tax=Apostasia shenzhenica TaxID=1088818 RepID=A0A2I0AFU4_9ASPA|nr:hypothetical protein AXF42_Ash000253 [Apostasia shenzhenica]
MGDLLGSTQARSFPKAKADNTSTMRSRDVTQTESSMNAQGKSWRVESKYQGKLFEMFIQ